METITIEKIIKFDNVIDSIDAVQVNNDLRYQLLDDNTHAQGVINLKGSVNTVLGQKDFSEDVDIDIYAPFEKIIDKDHFKIHVQDYSYMINQQNLIIYLVLSLEGIMNKPEETLPEENSAKLDQVENENIADSMNNLNEIKAEDGNTREEQVILQESETLTSSSDTVTNESVEEVPLENEIKKESCNVTIKENNQNETMNQTWATDLFKLSDNYTVFMKIHVE